MQTSHGATSTMETATSGVVPHGVLLPRSLLPPISHKRDISSANINRPLPVSFCYIHIILWFWLEFTPASQCVAGWGIGGFVKLLLQVQSPFLAVAWVGLSSFQSLFVQALGGR